jgi:quercetin dioxygenase-like cupin family protein
MTNRREFLSAAIAGAGIAPGTVQAQSSAAQTRVVRRQRLEGAFAGMEAVVTELTYPPGAVSGPHRHGGLVIGYVIEGEMQFAINDEPATTLRAGDTFYEPPGARHTVSGNARKDRPVRVVVTIIVPEGAQVTLPI